MHTLTPATASCSPLSYWLVLKDPYSMFDSQLSAMAIPGQNSVVCVCVCVVCVVHLCIWCVSGWVWVCVCKHSALSYSSRLVVEQVSLIAAHAKAVTSSYCIIQYYVHPQLLLSLGGSREASSFSWLHNIILLFWPCLIEWNTPCVRNKRNFF